MPSALIEIIFSKSKRIPKTSFRYPFFHGKFEKVKNLTSQIELENEPNHKLYKIKYSKLKFVYFSLEVTKKVKD